MTSAGGKNRIAAALDYLRAQNQFFQFDDQERVVHVVIDDTKNADEIAAHVGNLPDLEKLTFYGTAPTDSGFRRLAGLVGLKELNIEGSGFTSAGLAHLGAMSRLEEVYFDDASNFDLAAFAAISRIPSLRDLALRGGHFRDADLEPLERLVNLEDLSLTENDHIQGTFCKHLIGSSHLKKLNLYRQVSDDGLASISKLLSLEELFLEGPFTDAGLLQIDTLENLGILSIDSPRVTSAGVSVVAKLPNLFFLYLTTPLINDDSIDSLQQCSALDKMHVCRAGISESGIRHLREAMPRCAVYDYERDRKRTDNFDESDKERPSLDSNTPFETLLTCATDRDLVRGTYDKIHILRGHWLHASHYSPEERVIMLVFHTSNWLGGGFEYLCSEKIDGDPDYRITAESYRIAGIERSYKAFEAAFALFPGGVMPCDPEERTLLYEAANRSAREAINVEFWCDNVTTIKKLAEFIRTNAAKLGDLNDV